MSDDDFGHSLLSVQERDVDLLLMEEVAVNPGLLSFLADELGLGTVAGDGAWRSVSGADGETDLLVRARAGARRVAPLIGPA